MTQMLRALLIGVLALAPGAAFSQQGDGPLRIEITEGVIEPLPIAVPTFFAESEGAGQWAQDITRVVVDDLVGTGLFREVPPESFISRPETFDASVSFADWRAINAQGLVTGAVSREGERLNVKFRLWDIFSEQQLGEGLQFGGDTDSWRRIAHKVADQIYSRITGEGGYFDSRVVYVDEAGPKDARQKRLAIMDYDGANVQYLTGSDSIVLAPRFSPDGERVLYTSYASGTPQIYLLDLTTLSSRRIGEQPGSMTFAPRFAPNGEDIVFSLTRDGNTDIYTLNLASGNRQRLTEAPSIETAPSFSPDGERIVFESDRSGTQQLYVMPVEGGEARRISFGEGRYGTPVWSPRGDLIAFTKQHAGRFHIGVMRTDGSEERLLTASFLDEGPTWAPNGRVIMFTRESRGESGAPALYSVDISGRNLKQVATSGPGSDPAWSPLLP